MLGALRLFGGLLALVIVGIIVSPRDTRDGTILFLQQSNLFDILALVSKVGVLAVGMTVVILTGGIDLSVGSVLSLGSVVAAMLLLERGWHAGAKLAVPSLALGAGLVAALTVSWLMGERGVPVPRGRPRRTTRARAGLAAFLIAAAVAALWGARAAPVGMPVPLLLASVMAVGLLAGCLNGALVAYGGLQPFIATLASMISLWGLAWLIAGDNARRHISTGEAGSHLAAFNWLGSRVGGVVPVPGLFFIGAVVLAQVVLRSTRAGRQIYAIGGGEDAARLSGVPVATRKVLVYGVSGMLAALAGTLWAAQYHQGFPDAGQGAELDAIAAVVIGGTSLMGGRGGVAGTLAGVLMFGILNNILTLRQFDTNWQRLVTGIIIAVAVLLQEGRLRAAVARFARTVRGGA